MKYQQIQDFIYKEARLLDDRKWDEWLACYHKDVTYWMPSWDDDDELISDPQKEVSLIYYPNKTGLEDRVYRIKTERSGASMPEARTTHQCTNIEILATSSTSISLRFNFHTLSHRYRETSEFFGTQYYTIDITGEQPLIKEKRIILNNDYINQVLDVYHV
ncbi:benzoate 1,2-dioxygenase beta subunit [Pseudoalteromonas sp. BSi20311]|uniref:benzoate 1,2-dioxygenase small subunit n=1 Tax=unclassified Pseudoalteromonas TaxID=194690 RepID=UPI0002318C3D|nr:MULTISPECIES: benzoate 1,2-dioxygenase small subunit [unclassified Pseudoalteromonas]TMP57037.1 benzoate 1,2-dioxygenase small subunit [Pseudoalteromonas sp. S1612]GAA62432.1 benzoate 1,2-dioxygenase beta subunit [Pseudoalteromonas sp. BSi20311]HCP98926.1 benzoate 1,2-dioxygenase small subunit [Pseudoalteromonas sp.]|tara:strand:+ start:2032 stop:2514 length:483 start_codon:yes stop_codon:yes gene_type:complete